MREGRIEQQGEPLDLYDRPANRFVAGFIGSPAMNFVEGTVEPDGAAVRLGLPGAPVLPLGRRADPGRPVAVGLRPEHLQVDPAGAQIRLPVRAVESTGSMTYTTTESEPELMLVAQGRGTLGPGDPAPLRIEPAHVHLFDRETGLTL